MGYLIGIAGHSGSGKTTSIKNLNPKETFIVSITGKPLPFKGFRKNYTYLKKDGENYVGNFFVSKDSTEISKIFKIISIKMPHIKQIIIDDSNYLMGFEVMERAEEKGWDELLSLSI